MANLPQRFLDKVQFSDDPEGCWEWRAALNPDGYAQFWWENRTVRAGISEVLTWL